jgi:hypothetical protein
MTSETHSIPDWASRERESDLAWVQENRELFRAVASLGFEDVGRGAIVVDTTLQPTNPIFELRARTRYRSLLITDY